MPPPPLKFASRYKRDDGDEGDNDAILMQQAEQGDPALCMVFELPDEDEVPEEIVERVKLDREKLISLIKMLGFETEPMTNQAQNKIFLKITLPKDVLSRQAETRRIKMKLDKGAPGAYVPYIPKLEKKKLLREPEDDRKVFSSLQQLEMADFLLRCEPFSDGSEVVEKLIPEKLMKEVVPGLDSDDTPIRRILGYYYLHEPSLGFRGKLWMKWVAEYKNPQPLDLIRFYFGEKIALYYAWLGYYISMLWIPAVQGAVLAITQDSESPYNLIFCVALVVWTTMFTSLWRRFETRLMYEYNTVDFEESEELRLEFMDHSSTVKGTHPDELTGELLDFYMDKGFFFPPRGRRGRMVFSILFVGVFCVLAIAADIIIYSVIARPLMQPGDVMLGSLICGFLFATSSQIIEYIFEAWFEQMIFDENWQTATQHEDALITRSCPFRIVSAYFGPFFVAVVANNVPYSMGDLSCPDNQCLPVIRIVILAQFLTLQLWHEIHEHLAPSIRGWYTSYINNEALRKKVKKNKLLKFPMEEELELEDFAGVYSFYKFFVYQLGWVAMFASAFPFMPAMALVCNMVELRLDADALLTRNKRPRYAGARDIGSWQVVMETIASLSILTNSLLVGLTSHTLFFYLPRLTEVERLWCVAVLEHALFLLQLLVRQFLPLENVRDVTDFERRNFQARSLIQKWEEEEDD